MLFSAAILPGLSRIQLDQHWASDILAGAFMGVFAGYKVTTYSHDHPDNWFDRQAAERDGVAARMDGSRSGSVRELLPARVPPVHAGAGCADASTERLRDGRPRVRVNPKCRSLDVARS